MIDTSPTWLQLPVSWRSDSSTITIGLEEPISNTGVRSTRSTALRLARISPLSFSLSRARCGPNIFDSHTRDRNRETSLEFGARSTSQFFPLPTRSVWFGISFHHVRPQYPCSVPRQAPLTGLQFRVSPALEDIVR